MRPCSGTRTWPPPTSPANGSTAYGRTSRPGEWCGRSIGPWPTAQYNAGAESPTALYVVNWAATGAVLAFAGFAIARAFRVPRDRLATFLAVYGAAVFVYPWTLDLFAFASYQEKWVVLAAALGVLWFAEPRERLPAWQWYAVSAAVIGLGAMTKAQFVVFLPAFLLLVLDHRREGRASWSRIAAVTAMGLVAALALRAVAWSRRLHGGVRPLERARPARLEVPLARGGVRPRVDRVRDRPARDVAQGPHPDRRLPRVRLRLRAVAGGISLVAPRLRGRGHLRARRLAPPLSRAGDSRARGEPRLGVHVDRRADGRALLVADEHRRVRPLRARPRACGRRRLPSTSPARKARAPSPATCAASRACRSACGLATPFRGRRRRAWSRRRAFASRWSTRAYVPRLSTGRSGGLCGRRAATAASSSTSPRPKTTGKASASAANT